MASNPFNALMDPQQLGASIQNAFQYGTQQRQQAETQRALGEYSQNMTPESAANVSRHDPRTGIQLQRFEVDRAELARKAQEAENEKMVTIAAINGDPTARGTLAAAIHVPPAHAEQLTPLIDEALAKTDAEDPAFEALVRIKLATHVAGAAEGSAVDVDKEIASVFPSFSQLVKLAGFDSLVKSLRTAESLFHTTAGNANADLSPPITLWMKVLENYVHAWLGPRMATLQREPSTLFDYVDRVIGGSWNGFARWIEPKWKDPFEVGGAKVELPLRSVPNAVRERRSSFAAARRVTPRRCRFCQ
jgi:hypothetical protein